MAATVHKMSFGGRFLPICGRFASRHVYKQTQNGNMQLRQHISTKPGAFISREGKIRLGIVCTSAVLGFSAVKLFKKAPDMPKVDAAVPEQSERRRTMNFVADVVEMASPAVVNLEVRGRHFMSGAMMPVSSGSGFIVREDGLIVTNAHVVGNQTQVVVRLLDGRTMEGKVQAVDTVSDLATVKINAKDLPVLHLGRSSASRPGEWVVAVGSPFQLSNTVTCGIISSVRGSKELGMQKDMDYIQTDAIINQGNSGGPLINLDGDAIGINTLNLTTGISFAIPSDYVQDFLEKAERLEKRAQPSSSGWFSRGGGSSGDGDKPQSVQSLRRYLGITMLTLRPEILQELHARGAIPKSATHGVLVYTVVHGSPAFNADIIPGDLIIEIDGKPVHRSQDVYNALEQEADTELRVTVQRANGTHVITVKPMRH